MAMDTTLLVDNLQEVTLGLVKSGMERAMGYGNTSENVFFPNGDDVYIYGTEVDVPNWHEEGTHKGMRSCIAFRNYCGKCELQVIDSEGNFIVYNKITGLSKNALAEEYYHEICLVRHLIDGVAENAYEDVMREMFEDSKRRIMGTR